MPGLADLKSGAKKIDVGYLALPDGAQLGYTVNDPKPVTAIHNWFTAQLSDHGNHAIGHSH
jgi:hypothetical protein